MFSVILWILALILVLDKNTVFNLVLAELGSGAGTTGMSSICGSLFTMFSILRGVLMKCSRLLAVL